MKGGLIVIGLFCSFGIVICFFCYGGILVNSVFGWAKYSFNGLAVLLTICAIVGFFVGLRYIDSIYSNDKDKD